MGAHTGTGVGATVPVLGEQVADGLATVSGTFVGTVEIQVSMDGVSFAKTGSALTAPGTVVIPRAAKAVRSECTAYTSGTITTKAGWLNET